MVQTKKSDEKKEEVYLIKTKPNVRSIVPELLNNGYEVIHITGDGSAHTPKVFFLKGTVDLGTKLSKKERELIDFATEKEINEHIKESVKLKEDERRGHMAQKRRPGADIIPSQHYA